MLCLLGTENEADAMRIKYLSLAVLDLAIRAYISAKNPDAAQLWVTGSKSINA